MVVYTLFTFNDLLNIYTNLEPKEELPLDAELYSMVEDYTEYWKRDKVEEAARTTEDYIALSLAPRIEKLFIKNHLEMPSDIFDGKCLSAESRANFNSIYGYLSFEG